MERLTVVPAVASDYCAEASELAGESIVGTAAPVRVWLAIEHAGAWHRDAFASAGIPEAVRSRVAAWERTIPGLRPQLIRRPRTVEGAAFAVYLVLVDAAVSRAVRFDEMTFETLVALDLPRAAATLESGALPDGSNPVDQDLVLVCTHGKRDRCCAKRGTAVFDRVAADPRVCAWQTTHLGGHRFAATCVVLPHGACYGRLAPEDVPLMLQSHAEGSLFSLSRYRGRGCWSTAGQAAVHFVRRELGELALDAVLVERVETGADGSAVVHTRRGDDRHRVEVRHGVGQALAPPSCGKTPEPVRSFELVAIALE